MSRRPIDQHLARVPLFSELSKQQLRELSGLATPLDVKAGRVLMRQGEPGRELLVVIDGKADVQRGGATISSLGSGDFVGEIALLLDRPRTASVVATADMTIEVIEQHAFRAFLAENPALYEPLLKAALSRLASLDEDS
jgi:CRP/FNR family transcriptional regulator, cyclic AMP receptor protein